MRRAGQGIGPIFAQQSIREMTRTQRTPEQVMADACNAAAEAHFEGPMGADADHLKTPADVDRTAAAGFVFFTIDPSEFVDPRADDYSADEINTRAASLADYAPWLDEYTGKAVTLPTGSKVELTAEACRRAAVKYGRAIQHAVSLAEHIDAVMRAHSRGYEIELSVDETPQPTTLAEHYIIANECLRGGMHLVSLAPRFIGELEKGVDYKGDLVALERSLADHAAIAAVLGPYKLSLHSGSDKLSIYAILARQTRGLFHVKTAGTSYLEALRVVARCDEALFRRIVRFSRKHYERDKATYHVSATLASAPTEREVKDLGKLEKLYLGNWDDVPTGQGLSDPGRQILHCTFGSVLTDPELKPELLAVLRENPETHQEILAEHFTRHLQALQEGLSAV